MQEYNLNYSWFFAPTFNDDFINGDYGDTDFQSVDIPHNVKDIPCNYFDEECYQFISCYRKDFDADASWRGMACILTFEAVGHYAEVYINGILCVTHSGGYSSFNVDIEPYLKFEGSNNIVVKVDSTERPDIPPFGNVIDFLCYGGIYREVWLRIMPKSHIACARVGGYDVLNAPKIGIKLDFAASQDSDVGCMLKDMDGNIVDKFSIANCGKLNVEHLHTLACSITLWDVDNPYLYTLTMLYNGEEFSYRIGFRDVKFTNKGFYLNGKLVNILGLNRHQSYPYVGYAMPRSAQIADADYLKELGLNLARTAHYPNSKHFLNRCDEIGLMIFTEIPGWQHVSKREDWRQTCLNNVGEMIRECYNHPSIIIWGVRINESGDDTDLYTATNALAHQLDDTRQTGGVRCIPRSKLLEDVYTYNDFTHSGGKKFLMPKAIVCGNKPLLITEHNGHMFPTKSYDHEKKRQEHMLRHARVINESIKRKGTAGCIGWCMSDYNTHKDFGSGDKICYHGVSDMFRVDKLAAKLYRAQQDAYPVLEVTSNMEIGDVPGGKVGAVYIVTNCDKVNLYKNGNLINVFDIVQLAKHSELRHMPHPPIELSDVIGNQIEKDNQYNFSKHAIKKLKKFLHAIMRRGTIPAVISMPHTVLGLIIRYRLSIESLTNLFGKYATNWGDKSVSYRFEGVKDSKVCIVDEKAAAQYATLSAKADKTVLCQDATYDVTRIELTARNHVGARLPYCSEVITVTTTDNLQIIGDTTFALIGGARAFWIRTNGRQGVGKVTITSNIGTQVLEVNIASGDCARL